MSESLDRFERLQPGKSTGSIRQLIDSTFLAYNSARLREACHVFLEKYAKENVIIGVSAAGALTPAGLGVSCLVPLMDAGLIDWIVTTGANLYHDLHFALNQHLHIGKPTLNDCELRKNGIVLIYDILFDSDRLKIPAGEKRDTVRSYIFPGLTGGDG